jgi:hypothetical protein
MSWSEGSLTEASVAASVDGPCRIAGTGFSGVTLDGQPAPVTRTTEGSFEFNAKAGSSYELAIER